MTSTSAGGGGVLLGVWDKVWLQGSQWPRIVMFFEHRWLSRSDEYAISGVVRGRFNRPRLVATMLGAIMLPSVSGGRGRRIDRAKFFTLNPVLFSFDWIDITFYGFWNYKFNVSDILLPSGPAGFGGLFRLLGRLPGRT